MQQNFYTDFEETTATISDSRYGDPGKHPNRIHQYSPSISVPNNSTVIVSLKHANIISLAQVVNKLPLGIHNKFKTRKYITKNPNLLYKARLHAQKGRGDKIPSLNTCSLFVQQMANRGKAVHEAIMKSPIDTNMNDTEDTVMIEGNLTNRTQEGRKGSSSSKQKKSAELITGLKDAPRDFWLGIVAMEKLAIEDGIKAKDCRPPTKKEELTEMGMNEVEAEEMSHIHKIAFPHVKQLLYPLERPDGKGGQHYNLTQLPIETEVDPGTGLSLDYHIAVHFDRPSMDYTHSEILTMATSRLAHMNIEMGIGLAEPIYIPCKEKERNSKVKFWTGTIKIHLSRTLR